MLFFLNHFYHIFRALAKFHALSLAMKTIEPDSFSSEVATAVTECLFRPDNQDWYHDYYKSATNNAVAFVRECLLTSEERKRYLEKFETFVDESFFRKMMTLVEPREPVSVLCHGDCWTNNIMFEYTESGVIARVSDMRGRSKRRTISAFVFCPALLP